MASLHKVGYTYSISMQLVKEGGQKGDITNHSLTTFNKSQLKNLAQSISSNRLLSLVITQLCIMNYFSCAKTLFEAFISFYYSCQNLYYII